MIYLDSSAIVKLVVREPESEALLELLTDHPRMVSSALARVEVCRAVARCGARAARGRAREVLSRIALVRVDDALLDHAAEIQPTGLRSIDAIHLATTRGRDRRSGWGVCARTACFPSDSPYNVLMKELEFEWDPKKAKGNLEKHGVSFEEARTAFLDENAIQFFDPDHSEDEDRFLLLGLSFKLRVVIVCHCFRESEFVLRIVSARKADREEEGDYWRRR